VQPGLPFEQPEEPAVRIHFVRVRHARRYVLRPASPEPVEPVGLITLWPRGGLAMRLTRRR